MSANDILDVLNVQRDENNEPSKKKKKGNPDMPGQKQSGMARELYNLLGPHTPPVQLVSSSGSSLKDKRQMKVSPWSRVEFKPVDGDSPRAQLKLQHWVKGSKELIESKEAETPYFFRKYDVQIDIPTLVDEETYDRFIQELKEEEDDIKKEAEAQTGEQNNVKDDQKSKSEAESEADNNKTSQDEEKKDDDDKKKEQEWTYEETKYLFDLCHIFELKWHIIFDRYEYSSRRCQEDLKEHFYRICVKTLKNQQTANPQLIDSLLSFSKSKELERKKYLEGLLKRTPAEIAEEESLVIEARRFELAAKKMLIERSNLLTLLDSPQSSQSISQYQSSQGLANLYNNLMIIDKHQKKRQLQQQHRSQLSQDPVPPPIPMAASSSFKKDRTFQTPLQQHLSGVLKQNQVSNVKQETNSIQQLLMKRLTIKEEEAYGLHYHANERLTPGVILRSSQKLPGLQQRQSVLKSVNTLLQELDIPTAGGTSWKPIMPTRKTMNKYDELLRSVVTLLELKKGKDRLESEIRLIKTQRGIQ